MNYDEFQRETANDMVSDFDRQEIEERIQAQEKEDQIRQIRAQRQFVTLQNQAVNDGVSEACRELGLSVEEYARLAGQDPHQQLSLIKKAAKKLAVKTVRKRNPQGRFVKAGHAGSQPAGQGRRPVKSFDEIKSTDYGNRDNDRLDDIVGTVLDAMPPEFFLP